MKEIFSIAFHGLPATDWLILMIQEQAQKLERSFPRMVSCRVVVTHSHGHHRGDPKPFHVRIALGVPGGELVALSAPEDQVMTEDAVEAVLDAFQTARRLLQDDAQAFNGNTEAHPFRAAG